MALTYYALKNTRIGAHEYVVGEPVDIADVHDGPLLVKRGLIAADGGSGSSPVNPLWDDLRVSVLRGTTGPNNPTLTTFISGIQLYSFGAAGSDQIFFDAQIPHTWLEGSEVRPHLHWSPGNSTSTLVVRWGLEYSWSNVGDPFPTSTTIYANDAADGVAYRQQIAQFAPIDGTGKRVSSVFCCRLFRDGANGADTFTTGAFAISFDFHLQMSSDGSVDEYPGA